jgi:flagellar biosynthesis protein FliR
LAWILSHAAVVGIVFFRVLGMCVTAPGLAIPELDARFRIGLAAALCLVIYPVIAPAIVAPSGWANVAFALVLELLAGAVIGFAAALIVAGARMAGELVAAQAGLSTSTLLDPETGEEITPLGRLYSWVAVVAFLSLRGPLILVQSLVESYQVVPAGGLLVSEETASMAFAQVGRALELALKAAAPVALALALAGIVMGWISRAAASLPFVALALPIRTTIGAILLLLSVVTLFSMYTNVLEMHVLGR